MSGSARAFFKIGGTLASDAACYVERAADRELIEALRAGEFCYVLDTRQFGKSSLMSRTAARLREEGVLVAVIDLNALGECEEAEQWYFGMLDHLGEQLDRQGLQVSAEMEKYWEERQSLAPMHRLMNTVRDVVLKATTQRLVIMVDEIDYVRKLSALGTDEFFAGIRESYNRRARDPDFERLTFCLLGVASPSDLIKDTRVTPFNIGRRVELRDFTEAEAAGLRAGFSTDDATAAALLKRVLHWTGGHPYLTQRLACAVAEDPAAKTAGDVDRHCGELFLARSAREKDDNLIFVRDRLLRGSTDLTASLDLYGRIRKGRRVPNDEANPLVGDLRLAGIVRPIEGRLEVRNRIYSEVFDPPWIEKAMPDGEKRRQRRAFVRGLAVAAAIALLATGLYQYLWAWPFIEHFADFEKVHAIPRGQVKLTLAEVRQRRSSYRFVHSGRVGPLVRLEAINGLEKLTSDHEYSRSISPPDLPGGPRRECRWEFAYKNGELVSETAWNAYDDTVFSLVYESGGGAIRASYWLEKKTVLPQAATGASYVRFVRDPRGFDAEWIFEDGNGQRLRDSNRSFGYRFERDPNGREISRKTLGPDGEAAWHKDGWVIRDVAYDARGNTINTAYFDEQHQPVEIKKGYARCAFEFDSAGNTIEWKYFDRKGAPTTTDEAIHRLTSKREQHGFETESAYFDTSGRPTTMRGTDAGGYARRVMKYDANGFENERFYFDEKDQPTANMYGVWRLTLVNDDRGNTCWRSSWGADGQASAFQEGYAHYRNEYDARGMKISASYWDKNALPTLSDEGIFWTAYRYDELGRMIERRYFGTDGKPTLNNEGYSIARWAFINPVNRFDWSEVAFFDANEQPIAGPKNAVRVTQRFDGGDLVELIYRGADNTGAVSVTPGEAQSGEENSSAVKDSSRGSVGTKQQQSEKSSSARRGSRAFASSSEEDIGVPAMTPEGWGRKLNEYDKEGFGLLKVEEFYALDGKEWRRVVLPRGQHRILSEHDERGRVVASIERDLEGKTAPGAGPVLRGEYLGRFDKFTAIRYFESKNDQRFALPTGVSGMSFTHDEAGRRTSKTTLDRDDNAIDVGGFATYRQEYNSRGDLVRESWLTAKQAAARGPDGHAAVAITSDPAGREIERQLFDAEGKLVRQGFYYAILRQRRDERGRVVEKAYLDADEKPARNAERVAKVASAYDERGRVIEERCFDEKGQLAPQRDGYVIKRMTYDVRGRVASESCFNASDTPVELNEAHRISFARDEQGRIVTKQFFRADPKNVFASRLVRFDDQSRMVEESYLDAKGDPIDGPSKYSVSRIEYDPKGQWTRYAYFDRDRNPTRTSVGFREMVITLEEAAGSPPASRAQMPAKRRRVLGFDGKNGYTGRLDLLNAAGNVLEQRFLDEKDQPVRSTDGYAIIRLNYDPKGRRLSMLFLDADESPARSPDGMQKVVSTYDLPGDTSRHVYSGFEGSKGYVTREDLLNAAGQPLEQRYLDAENKLVRIAAGYAMLRRTYDGQGRRLSMLFFDADESPARGPDGAQKIVSTYGLPDGTSRNVYSGFDGSKGYVTREDLLNAAGQVIEERYLDAENKPVRNESKYAIGRSTFDEKGRLLSMVLLDADGSPAPVFNRPSGVVSTYDLPGGRTRRVLQGFDGTLGYAGRVDLLDARGNIVAQEFLDAHGQPVELPPGYASSRTDFDEQGRLQRIAYFGRDGQPARGAGGFIEAVSTYENARDRAGVQRATGYDGLDGFLGYEEKRDAAGNAIEARYLDADGQPVPGALGYAIARSEFDSRNRLVLTRYFDPQDQPVRTVRGYQEMQRSYGSDGGTIDLFSGYDVSVGYEKCEERSDQNERILSETYLDAAGRPVKTRLIVVKLIPNGEGERVGLRADDVLLSYAGEALSEMQILRARAQERGTTPRELRVWRGGKVLSLPVRPGLLGVYLVNKVIKEVPPNATGAPLR